jgi:hypothetical protein
MARSSVQLVAPLIFAVGFVCGSATASALQTKVQSETPSQTTLTQQSPEVVFPLDDAQVQRGDILLLRLVAVDNPQHADFTVNVALAPGATTMDSSQRVPVGSMGVYPAQENHGLYTFDLAPAIRQLKGHARHACIVLQLKPLHPSREWNRLRVTVTNPQWKEVSGGGKQ